MGTIFYNTYKNKKKCDFKELIGNKVVKFEIYENLCKLVITCDNNIEYILDGYNVVYNNSYIENKIDDLNEILNEKILVAEEVEVEYNGGDILFFYNIETSDKFIQIRFIGEDDSYYASEIQLYRTKTECEVIEHIEEGEKIIEKIQADMDSIKIN